MNKTVYEPQEDSLLLLAAVKKYARGTVLDMGCGSGIQGITALMNRNVTAITFADINPSAITHAKTAATAAAATAAIRTPLSFVHSDLFATIPREALFDTIIFNPPYLPDDEYDAEKHITTGGKEGYETILRFLQEAKDHLARDGIILLLFSSLSRKSVIDKALRELSYEKNLVGKTHVFMENLYVYLLKRLQDPDVIFKGHRGIVEKKQILHHGKPLVVAVKRPRGTSYQGKKEAAFLQLLNTHHIGPQFIAYDAVSNTLTMAFIEGDRIVDYLEKSSTTKKDIMTFLREILGQIATLDALHINKQELTNPYKHIIVTKSRDPVFIDFERCHYTPLPKNITQFIQFLASKRMNTILKKKMIDVDTQTLHDIARKYKRHPTQNVAADIMQCMR